MNESIAVHERALLNFEDAAAVAGGLSVKTLRREVTDGRLRTTRVRGRVLIARADLDRWIASCRERPAE